MFVLACALLASVLVPTVRLSMASVRAARQRDADLPAVVERRLVDLDAERPRTGTRLAAEEFDRKVGLLYRRGRLLLEQRASIEADEQRTVFEEDEAAWAQEVSLVLGSSGLYGAGQQERPVVAGSDLDTDLRALSLALEVGPDPGLRVPDEDLAAFRTRGPGDRPSDLAERLGRA